MLAEPPHHSYAASAGQWKAVQQAGIPTLQQMQPYGSRWELWSYTPALLRQSDAVDPLSLTLSLQEEPDERVQQALEELKGRFPW
jgi:hypothetical protein